MIENNSLSKYKTVSESTSLESNAISCRGFTNVNKDWHHPATPTIDLPKMSDDGTDEEFESDVLLEEEPEFVEPPMYAVIMYNDNYTPMEFVVYVLQSEFKHSLDNAVDIMLKIHNNGQGIAGIYPKDIAETKAQKTNQLARKEGFPLLTQIEPHQG